MDNIWITWSREEKYRGIFRFQEFQLYLFSFSPAPRVIASKGDFRPPHSSLGNGGRKGKERGSTLELISRRIARIPPTPLLDFPRPVYMRRMSGSRNGGEGEEEEERSTLRGGRVEKVAGRKRKKTTDRGGETVVWKRGEVCRDAFRAE